MRSLSPPARLHSHITSVISGETEPHTTVPISTRPRWDGRTIAAADRAAVNRADPLQSYLPVMLLFLVIVISNGAPAGVSVPAWKSCALYMSDSTEDQWGPLPQSPAPPPLLHTQPMGGEGGAAVGLVLSAVTSSPSSPENTGHSKQPKLSHLSWP